MKQYKNYIFDLYGTLLDIRTDETQIRLWRQLQDIYQRFGVTFDSPQQLRTTYRNACQNAFQQACFQQQTQYGEPDLLQIFQHLLPHTDTANKETAYVIANVFRALSIKRLCLYNDTIETLKTLETQGKKIYLLSNAQTIFTMPELRHTNLLPYFTKVYISSDYGIKKPDVRFMEQLLKENHLPVEDCVMVGNDFYSDIAIAQSVGMDAIFINTDKYQDNQITAFMKACKMPEQVRVIQQLKELL